MIDKLNLNGVAFRFPLRGNSSFLKHSTIPEFRRTLLVKGNTNFPFIKFLIWRGLWPNDRRLPRDFHLRPGILWILTNGGMRIVFYKNVNELKNSIYLPIISGSPEGLLVDLQVWLSRVRNPQQMRWIATLRDNNNSV